MKVSFSAEALGDASAHLHLDAIVYEIERGMHEWHVGDPESIEASSWLKAGRPSLRTLFEQAAKQWSPRATERRLHRRLLAVGAHSPPDSLSPAKAAAFLRGPLKVLMENRLTDGAFLDAVLALLADNAVMLLKDELRALAYDSPGGIGDLKKLVAKACEDAHKQDVPVRIVVFIDGDGIRPGQVSSASQAVQDLCASVGVPCIVLRKRSIENYLPDEAIREWRDEHEQTGVRDRIDAVLRLTSDQRDHWHMKEGLGRKKHDEELFSSLSASDRLLLARGFGTDFVLQVLNRRDFGPPRASATALESLRETMTADALRRRDGRGELDALVAHIEEAL